MSPGPPNEGERRGRSRAAVHRQRREDLAMTRFRVCLMGLVVVLSLWAAPAGAQDKFTMGYGSGT